MTPRRASPRVDRRALLALAAAALAGPAARARAAAPPSLYTDVPRSADGIGKATLGREIAAVMGWQGAAWLEREEREKEERTDLLLQALPLAAGMTVADIGAGTGYLSRRLAAAIGPTGAVVAVDVQPEMVRLLQRLPRSPGAAPIRAVLGRPDDVALAPKSVDLAIMVDVYHELEFPHEVLESILRALKPAGRLVFVEYRAEDARVPIKPVHKMTEAQVRREAGLHALDWERTVATLPWQHVIVFRKR